ncbi:hypothetical protein EJ03DRAFT_195154 [Teratosphaeria nubilosa]|uniref:Uncharacterized protein n=1 Tax=Teratosphaeria nubilosa TaxID=161662 RepID=A0A6G1L056_9PEZI|nr:hypothetical protein EJ03DRAFT_195154 [Teratosphaeria nubilosa]
MRWKTYSKACSSQEWQTDRRPGWCSPRNPQSDSCRPHGRHPTGSFTFPSPAVGMGPSLMPLALLCLAISIPAINPLLSHWQTYRRSGVWWDGD